MIEALKQAAQQAGIELGVTGVTAFRRGYPEAFIRRHRPEDNYIVSIEIQGHGRYEFYSSESFEIAAVKALQWIEQWKRNRAPVENVLSIPQYDCCGRIES